jgi:hypothetical protein
MSELGEHARGFLANARTAHDAPADAKDRVRAGLVAALAIPTSASAPSRSTANVTATWIARGKLAFVAAVVGGGVALGLGRATTHSLPLAAPAPSPAASVMEPPPAPWADASQAPAAPRPSVEVVASPPPAPRAHDARGRETDRSVAAEVAILRRVSDALRAGDAKGALAGVDEHARRFPSGALAEERDMERIVALCALGRRDDATRATLRFTRAYPSSSHDARIREACASPPAPASAAP